MLAWYGVVGDPNDLALPPPLLAGSAGSAWPAGAVLIHPGASGPERCWPVDRYAAVAAALRAAGHRVLVTGLAAEAPLAAAVAEGAGLPADAVVAGHTDLAALAGLVARARLVLCGDTGVAHLATAYGTPSVVLFGPMAPAVWGPPPGRPEHVAVWRGPASLGDITVADVLDAADQAVADRAVADQAVGDRAVGDAAATV
jgi:ADP-heptose:LPS heptosyltransferase